MKKQFDLQYYLTHPDVKVVTRDGRNVRIICTDNKSKNGYIVIALVPDDTGENEFAFSVDTFGKHVKHLQENVLDLFFDLPDPVKKRVPLTYEDLLERVKDGKTMWMQDSENCSFISYFDQSGYVCFGNLSYTVQAMMEHSDKFVDGTPCWKEVEE